MKIKSIIASIAIGFLFIFTCVGTGLAYFFFEAQPVKTQNFQTKLDDIEENYSVSDDSFKAQNYYDVYFFAQSYAADTATPRYNSANKFIGVNYSPVTTSDSYVRYSSYYSLSWHDTKGTVRPQEYGYWPSKTIVSNPDIQMRGFLYLKDSEPIVNQMSQILSTTLNALMNNSEKSISLLDMERKINDKLSKYLLKETNKEPMILTNLLNVDELNPIDPK